MADLHTLTAPLTVRTPTGDTRVVAHHFRHPEGTVIFDLYWHLGAPDESIHVIRGETKGDGPWKVGDHVFNVLGCHGTNSELALAYDQWQSYLKGAGDDYPAPPLIAAIARRYGATTDEN